LLAERREGPDQRGRPLLPVEAHHRYQVHLVRVLRTVRDVPARGVDAVRQTENRLLCDDGSDPFRRRRADGRHDRLPPVHAEQAAEEGEEEAGAECQRVEGDDGRDVEPLRRERAAISRGGDDADVRVDDVILPLLNGLMDRAHADARPDDTRSAEARRIDAVDADPLDDRFARRRRDDLRRVAGGDQVLREVTQVELEAAQSREKPVADERDAKPCGTNGREDRGTDTLARAGERRSDGPMG
jgi:hypothetical protein